MADGNDAWKDLCATKSRTHDWWAELKASAQAIRGNPHFGIALKSLAGLLVLATIIFLILHVDQQEKKRLIATAQVERSEIDDFCRINPTAYRAAIQRYDTLISHLEGSSYTALRQSAIAKRKSLDEARKKHVEKVMKDLREEVQPLIEQRQFLRAASIVSSFKGEMENETLHERMRFADTLNEQAAQSSRTRSLSGNE